MTKDDLKVWARRIYLQKLESSKSNLLQWMEEELTARLRSGAAIRKNGPSRTSHVVASINRQETARATGQPDDNRENQNQCYIFKGAHNLDLCTRFLAMTPQERWKVVKEQRGCFSCLKRSRGLSPGNACAKKGAPKKDAMVLRVKRFVINFFTLIMDWKDQRSCKFHLFKTVAKRYFL